MACQASKPILVHDRDAHDAVIEILDKFKDQLPTIIIHCFTGTPAEAKAYVARGFYIGITGYVCKGMLHIAHLVPLKNLFSSNLCPDLFDLILLHLAQTNMDKELEIPGRTFRLAVLKSRPGLIKNPFPSPKIGRKWKCNQTQ